MYPFIYNATSLPSSMHYLCEEDEDLLLQQISIYGLLQQQQQQHHHHQQQQHAFGEEENLLGAVVAEAEVANNNNDNDNNDDDFGINEGMKKKNKKCCGKKDRHSKIHTAQGPRDRRMRLSLDVARKFFDLQDTLGFDKASKTVDWLLNKSRFAIDELANNNANASSNTTSECEGNSGVVDQEFFDPFVGMEGGQPLSVPINDGNRTGDKKGKGGRTRVSAAFSPLSNKESRNKARERARERTKMKNLLTSETVAMQPCFPEATEAASDHSLPPEEHNNWSLSSIFQYHQNPPTRHHQQQFADLSYSRNYWEGYSNGNL
ncbi:hypothetical protein DM860_010062 [Cuscuta australis]|uniref:TCP domain-containing protein n=1 Tax=Cuscuta australis TaxID=267555 RepID=A0A328D9Z7_9ASTE|nr:hypothetical protein DM860_010062 [Cuscuta australis]